MIPRNASRPHASVRLDRCRTSAEHRFTLRVKALHRTPSARQVQMMPLIRRAIRISRQVLRFVGNCAETVDFGVIQTEAHVYFLPFQLRYTPRIAVP
jgi:hypothetical protein